MEASDWVYSKEYAISHYHVNFGPFEKSCAFEVHIPVADLKNKNFIFSKHKNVPEASQPSKQVVFSMQRSIDTVTKEFQGFKCVEHQNLFIEAIAWSVYMTALRLQR